MQLLPVWAIMAAALAPRSLASVDVSCDCHLWHRKQTSVSLHCVRGQNEASTPACKRANVPDIPRGYHYVPGYALVKLYWLRMPWPVAKKICEDEGSQLATPRDQQAFDGLREIFNQSKPIPYANIGFTDELKEGTFLGLDGRPASSIPWGRDRPDDRNHNENCLDFNNEGESNDVNCDNPAPFFCERRLSVPIRDGYTWVEEAGRFYKVHNEQRTYEAAAEVCRSENARLAVPDTWQRGEALHRQFELDFDNYQSFFIGFKDEAVEGDFVTETGRHLSDMEFQVWGVNEPNNNDNGKPENCLTLVNRGFYNDMRCDRKLPFICEILPL